MTSFAEYAEVIFWDFKRRDNVVYNFVIVESLIHAAKKTPHEHYFYKPIFIVLTSIIECTLYDFLCKVHEHRYERVPNITKDDIQAVQNMELPNKLTNFTDICRKHKFLGSSPQIYEALRGTAKIRNRIHIQNGKYYLPLEETNLWNADLVKGCGALLRDIFKIMVEKYPRPESFHRNPFFTHFPTPWDTL